MYLCSNFWKLPEEKQGRVLLHEWAHYELGIEREGKLDRAECYAALAFELGGATGIFAEKECPANKRPLPARNDARLSVPCPR